MNNYTSALDAINNYKDTSDVKMRKLRAQILLKLNRYAESLIHYKFVVNNIVDITPSDIIEYSEILLLVDATDFEGAVNAIDVGLKKLGSTVVTLRTKKIEYLISSNQSDKVIIEFDSLISEYNRKEFWYYKKAIYLHDLKRISDCEIAIEHADASIQLLSPRHRGTRAIKELQSDLLSLKTKLDYEK